MDIAQALTLADRLLIDFGRKTKMVVEIHQRLKAPKTIQTEVELLTSKVDREVWLGQQSKHFCGLSGEEQREYLKKYKNGNGNGNGNGDQDAHSKK